VLLAMWSAKGGSGPSVVAAALAVITAGRGKPAWSTWAATSPLLGLPPLQSLVTVVDWLPAGAGGADEWLDDMACCRPSCCSS
jgi:hypothetical protein